MGYISKKIELTSIIRRFDTDGDAKINLSEFTEGLRSALLVNSNSS
jgi:Ca2+-binding EF-hand superfamily protein